jgi:drug/metabolite transporter (DMT)-like permease
VRPSTLGPVARCALSALLFGAATPASKGLAATVDPFVLAGVLYLGAALAVAPFALRRGGLPRKPGRANVRRLAGAVVAGGVVAPVLLLLGLRAAHAADVSLWMQLEVVATTVLAVVFFRENVGRRTIVGLAVAVAGGVLLAAPAGAATFGAAALVALACCGWGLDNNLVSLIDGFTPSQTTFVKGLVAGATNLTIGLALGGATPGPRDVGAALAIGAVCYGASIALYVSAAQDLGASRSQVVFASAPFVGAAISWIALGETFGVLQAVAGVVMLAGVAITLTARHTHEHAHEATTHVHAHRHDDGHHDHEHPGLPPSTRHTHEHTHAPKRHAHPHEPDLHHRHTHG